MSPGWNRAAILGCMISMTLLCGPWTPARAEAPASSSDLANLSLEQLGNVEVTSVSRRRERLADVPASMYVITAEDIRRSGVKTIPEALRLCPTLEVARADANQYAISARGFNSVLANKMLVLIDGRTVYSPLFSGVFWEAQDLLLGDVDRIEIVSGPAGTSWGTNAVNGVINIVTRTANETKGTLASAGASSDLGVIEGRYGWGNGPYFRAYGKAVTQENSELENGSEVRDASQRALGGVRGRWVRAANSLWVDGGGYRNEIEQVPDQRIVSGYHLQANWERQPVKGAVWQAQAYYERSMRDQPAAVNDALDTWDLSLQNEFEAGIHSAVLGAGYRYQPDDVENLNVPALALIPDDHILHFGYVFGEDALRLHKEVTLTGGVRFEHNGYTGWETLPTLRLSWQPRTSHFVWVAASRAVRAPARVDRELYVPGTAPHFILDGGPDFQSEILKSVELGYRAQPFSALSYSISGYLGHYDRLRSLEPTPTGPQFENGFHADVRGLESWANYRVTNAWRLSAGGFVQHQEITKDPDSHDLGTASTLGSDPDNSWMLRSAFDVGERGEADFWARHAGPLSNSAVPAYTSLNARLGWRLHSEVELSLAGYDLVGPRHVEWGTAGNRASFGRTVFAQVQYRLGE
jgi:iron complex outermembrane receptor protein